jgi:hypothetical protein
LALEEFGDAAGLAAQLVSIVQGRRKRWIMRIGTISVVGLAAAVLLGVAFWPEGAKVKAPQAVAQTGDKPGVPKTNWQDEQKKSIEESWSSESMSNTPVPKMYWRPQGRECKCMSTARECLPHFPKFDAPVTINLKQVRLDMVLDLVLEQAGEGVGLCRAGWHPHVSVPKAAAAKPRSTTAATCWRWRRRCRVAG